MFSTAVVIFTFSVPANTCTLLNSFGKGFVSICAVVLSGPLLHVDVGYGYAHVGVL